jgi:hypothetical protein
MPSSTADLLFGQLAATADTVVSSRPDVDPQVVHEIFDEAGTLLHNGLALDHLDEHDVHTVVTQLCVALVDADPATALMTRFYAATEAPAGLHDPDGVALAYENVLRILEL